MSTRNSPPTAPTVSVIVPSFRGARRLPALFDSLARQDAPSEEFEVIVVVDGVVDASCAIIEAETRFNVRALMLERNQGRVGALNAGFAEAKGRILVRCDDDLVLPPSYISAHVKAHADGSLRGVVGKTRDIHEDSTYARVYGREAAERSFEYASTRDATQRWRLWAASCSIDRKLWEELGPYSSAYRAYGWEDVDYGWRIHEAGYPIEIAEAATAEHHAPARSTAARAAKAFDSGAARATFRKRHPAAPLGEHHQPTGAWAMAVRAMARIMQSWGSITHVPALVDRVLPYLPRGVGKKLVALQVEAAGLAGDRLGKKCS